jgi:hypothetical protein
MAMSMITVKDKLKCVERELEYRKRVYPRLIAGHKMSQAVADRELRLMDSIVEDYRRSAQVIHEPQAEMFDNS